MSLTHKDWKITFDVCVLWHPCMSLQNSPDSCLVWCSQRRYWGGWGWQGLGASGTGSALQSPQRNYVWTTVWAWVQMNHRGPNWCCRLDFPWGTGCFHRKCSSSLRMYYGCTPVTSRECVDDKDRKTNLVKVQEHFQTTSLITSVASCAGPYQEFSSGQSLKTLDTPLRSRLGQWNSNNHPTLLRFRCTTEIKLEDRKKRSK